MAIEFQFCKIKSSGDGLHSDGNVVKTAYCTSIEKDILRLHHHINIRCVPLRSCSHCALSTWKLQRHPALRKSA